MANPAVAHIIAFFLFVNGLFFCRYYWRRMGYSLSWLPINPLGFIAVLFCFLVLTGVFCFSLGIERVFLALALGLGAAASLLSPVIAVSFLVASLLLRPWEVVPPSFLMAILPRSAAGLALLSWVIYSARKSSFKIRWNFSCTLYVCFVMLLVLSALLSGSVAEGLDFVSNSFIPITVVAFQIINAVEDDLDIWVVKGSVVISVVGLMVCGLFMTLSNPAFGSAEFRFYGPGLFSNANDMAALAVLILPFPMTALLAGRTRYAARLLSFAAIAVLALSLWLSQSRGALLALVFSGIVYVFFCLKSRRAAFLAASLLFLLPIALYLGITRPEQDTVTSRESRWNYAITGLLMLKRSPIWGVGPGNYPKLYNSYTRSFMEEGERTAHSSWVLVMAEGGLVGLLLFVGFYLTAVRAAWRVRLVHPDLILSLAGYGMAISFLSHTYLFLPYLLAALVLAAVRVYLQDGLGLGGAPGGNRVAVGSG